MGEADFRGRTEGPPSTHEIIAAQFNIKASYMQRPLLLLGLICALAPGQQTRDLELQPVTSLPAKDKRWALLVGVDEYEDDNISRLKAQATTRGL